MTHPSGRSIAKPAPSLYVSSTTYVIFGYAYVATEISPWKKHLWKIQTSTPNVELNRLCVLKVPKQVSLRNLDCRIDHNSRMTLRKAVSRTIYQVAPPMWVPYCQGALSNRIFLAQPLVDLEISLPRTPTAPARHPLHLPVASRHPKRRSGWVASHSSALNPAPWKINVRDVRACFGNARYAGYTYARTVSRTIRHVTALTVMPTMPVQTARNNASRTGHVAELRRKKHGGSGDGRKTWKSWSPS